MGWSGRVRAGIATALAVFILVTLWRMSECWRGSAAGCGYLRYFRDDQGVGRRKRSSSYFPTQTGGKELPVGGGIDPTAAPHRETFNKRAIAVVFSDVHDVLVLERALALWRSIETFFSKEGSGDDVVAIVPQYRALQLEAPLREIGYRVLPRDSPAPAWRASGRFVQQALTKGGASSGSSLLALEALTLTEYEEVAVLDQKMIIFQANQDLTTEGVRREPDGGGSSSKVRGEEEGKGTKNPVKHDDANHASPRESLVQLLLPPQRWHLYGKGEGWSMAFAEGGEASVARGEGLTALPEALQGFVTRRHASLMVVRPNPQLYDSITNILCKGDVIMDGAYIDVSPPREESIRSAALERRAPTAPLLHLAVALSSSSLSQPSLPTLPLPGDDDAPLLSLKACGGGSRGLSGGALPVAIAWCPLGSGGEDLAQDEAGEIVDGYPGRSLAGVPSARLGEQRTEAMIEGRERFGISPGSEVAREMEITSQRVPTLAGRGRFGSIPGLRATSAAATPARIASREGMEAPLKTSPLTAQGFQWWKEFARRRRRGVSSVASASNTSRGAVGTMRGRRALGNTSKDVDVFENGKRGKQKKEAPAQRRNEGEKEDTGSLKALDGADVGDGVGGDARGGGSGWSTLWRRLQGTPRVEKQRELDEEVDLGRSINLAWIPEDPCSCAGAEGEGGVVGEACRAWLEARSAPLRLGAEAPPDARSACRDGAFTYPRSVPRPVAASVLRDLEFAGATAGASLAMDGAAVGKEQAFAAGADGLKWVPKETNGGEQVGYETPPSPPAVPRPLWQQRPNTKAIITEQDLRGFQHFWAVNEEKKILIVAIPKVACTQIHALFLRMQGSKGWNSPVLAQIHYHKDQSKYTMRSVEGMTAQKASDILNDPSWTRGVFLRDPADRLLSCFLDKIVHRKSYSVNILKAREILSFEAFVGLLSKDAKERYGDTFPGPQLGISRQSNPHWKPQLYFGLDKFLPYFDFIGDFNHVQEHSEELLRRAGLWDEFGASGWGPDGKNAFFQRSTVQGHATGSESAKSIYYSHPLLASVREAYGPTDYHMLAKLGWWNETTFP